MKTRIKTVNITPTKDMPSDLFRSCHRMSYFTELMERTGDHEVIWDDELEAMYNEGLADAEYIAMKRDWVCVCFTLPEAFVNINLEIES